MFHGGDGSASRLAIDEGEFAEGAAGFERREFDAVIGDVALAIDEDIEFIADVAFSNDGCIGFEVAFEGDGHDLEHFLITEIFEEANLSQSGNAAIGFEGSFSGAGVRNFDADDGDFLAARRIHGIIDEEIGGMLRVARAVELGEVRFIFEGRVGVFGADDEAVALFEVDLEGIDEGGTAHAEGVS